jgi:hypothetical protein
MQPSSVADSIPLAQGAGSGLGERPKTFIWAAFRNRIFSIGAWAGRQLGQT